MIRRLNWLVVFSLLFAVGCFLSAARADEERRGEPEKGRHERVNPERGVPEEGRHDRGMPEKGRHERGVSEDGRHDRGVAQDRHEREEHREARHDFRSHHDYRHFTDDERTMWRGGAWRHERYQGRLGWWWVVGGMRYFYAQPVYPYPQVVPSVVFEVPVIPAPVIVIHP